eukprot:XP_011671003.1 PREDICTED: sushi, von Willebrand factor type A, EGF and pentraxin domain-containing protein 1 isoform X3 [Strongylocentrotus purpuratus]
MSAEAGRTRISSCLLSLFFILIIAGSCDGWLSRRRRRRRRSPSPDTTAPTFTYCPNTIPNEYMTFSKSKSVFWRTPTATDDRGSATVSLTSGMGPRSIFGEGLHSTQYTARDIAGNQATCTVSFTVIAIRCTPLSSIPVHGSLSCTNSVYFASRCYLSCSTGYRPLGNSVRKICISSGTSGIWNPPWSTPFSACVPITCTSLRWPTHGSVSCSNSVNFGSNCTYSCSTGYRTSWRSVTRSCSGNSGTWSGSAPACVRIRCSRLSRPFHGSVSCSNYSNVGSNCTYSCLTGYRTSWGSMTRSCSRSGTWSGSAPACARISCGALSSLSNGQVSCSDSSYYSSLCNVSCNEGYTLHGSSSRLCGVSGSWSGSNTSCADTTAPKFTNCPNIIGNQYTTTTGMTVWWSKPGATDNDGLAPVFETSGSGPGSTFAPGSHSTTYTARDSAGNQATCTVSFTVIVRCTSLSAPIHGSVSCSNSASVGSHCTYSCSTGYRTSGVTVTRFCFGSGTSGNWSGSAPACVRISCGALSSPSNGQVNCSDSSYYNSLCNVSCNEGYTLQRSSSRLCGESGSWSGSNPSCADTAAPVFTRCPPSQTVYAPALSSSATISWSAPTVSDNSGESITPRLDVGSTEPGTSRPEGTHAVAYVAVDGSGNEASCRFTVTVTVIRCSSLSASAPLQVACPNGAIRGSVCTYGCGVGYRLQGQRPNVKCQKSGSAGSWSQPPLTCQRIHCRKHDLTTALQITTTQACPYGDQVPSGNQCHFSCSAGYYLTGNAALTCQHDRTWNLAAPTCHLITCSGSDLPAPVNGEKLGCTSSSENYGAVCTLACNDGYLPATPVQRTCSDDGNGGENGVWAGPDLTCTNPVPL